MSVSPHCLLGENFVLLLKLLIIRGPHNMNLLDVLTEREQRICIQLLMGISMFMVAILHRLTIGEVDEYRLAIIGKLEKVSLTRQSK